MRARLLEEHVRLRDLIDHALVLADRLMAGTPVDNELALELAELRLAFTTHNDREQAWLEPMLQTTGSWGPARIARMVEEHAAEHLAFRTFLEQPLPEIAHDLVDFSEEIEAHMAAEESTFLSAAVAEEATANRGE